MNYGYTAIIGNRFLFIIAKSIDAAHKKCEEMSEGKHYELDSSRHYLLIK